MSTQHDRSFKALPKIEKAHYVGCFYCCKTYSPSLIEEWVDGKQTAICPKCGIDSVVPFEITLDGSLPEFKEKLKVWKKESF